MDYIDDVVVEMGGDTYSYRRLPMGIPSLPSSFSRFADLVTERVERAVGEGEEEVRRDEIRFAPSRKLCKKKK